MWPNHIVITVHERKHYMLVNVCMFETSSELPLWRTDPEFTLLALCLSSWTLSFPLLQIHTVNCWSNANSSPRSLKATCSEQAQNTIRHEPEQTERQSLLRSVDERPETSCSETERCWSGSTLRQRVCVHAAKHCTHEGGVVWPHTPDLFLSFAFINYYSAPLRSLCSSPALLHIQPFLVSTTTFEFTHIHILFQSAPRIYISYEFTRLLVCLFFSRITQRQSTRFPWNLMEGWDTAQEAMDNDKVAFSPSFTLLCFWEFHKFFQRIMNGSWGIFSWVLLLLTFLLTRKLPATARPWVKLSMQLASRFRYPLVCDTQNRKPL